MPLVRETSKPMALGFSLIELLAVIAIIAILASLLLPAVASAKKAGNRAADTENLHSLAAAATIYTEDSDGLHPISVDQLVAVRLAVPGICVSRNDAAKVGINNLVRKMLDQTVPIYHLPQLPWKATYVGVYEQGWDEKTAECIARRSDGGWLINTAGSPLSEHSALQPDWVTGPYQRLLFSGGVVTKHARSFTSGGDPAFLGLAYYLDIKSDADNESFFTNCQ